MNQINVLHITLDYDITSGVTTYLHTILPYFKNHNSVRVRLLTNRGNALHILQQHSIETILYPMERGLKEIPYYLPTVQFLKHFCKKNEIHILHTHHRIPELIANTVAKHLGIGTVTTAHSIVNGWKYLSYRSQKIIAVSNAVRKHILTNYPVNPRKIDVIYNPVETHESIEISDNEQEIVRSTLGISKHECVLLYCGRHEKIKGLDILKCAFTIISQRKQNCVLLLIGDKTIRSITVIPVNGTNRIIMVPPQASMKEYFSIADIVVVPSLRDPFPYVMIEAGVYKKAFIGSSVDGIAEFIEDGKDGVLVPPCDHQALAEAILKLLNNRDLRLRMAQNLALKVRTKIPTVDEYCKQIVAIYRELQM